MAFPVIVFDSAVGSDSAASGAGPSTALTGSSAATDGAGTTVTLDAGTNLTNVATDGSHVIYLVDSTSGARNFGKITGKAGSGGATPTVTVANAFGLSLSGKSWAIGGKRASLGSTSSRKLINNNSSAGDAKAGWTLRFASGHAESTGSRFLVIGSGDGNDGPLIIEGEEGYSTIPTFTITSNTEGFQHESSGSVVFRRFKAIKTSTVGTLTGVRAFSAASCIIEDVISENFGVGFELKSNQAGRNLRSIGCTIGILTENVGNSGINIDGFFISGGTTGISLGSGGDGGTIIQRGTIKSCSGSAVSIPAMGSPSLISISLLTTDAITGDGIDVANDADTHSNLTISDSTLNGCGGYGIDWNGTSAATLAHRAVKVRSVNFYNNTSGAMSVTGFGEKTYSLDPQFIDASNNNYGIGANLKALASIGAYLGSNTVNYQDLGASQRQEPAATIAAFALNARS